MTQPLSTMGQSPPGAVTGTRLAPLASIDGWPINVPDMGVAIDAITDAAAAGRPSAVFTLNLDHLVKLRTNAAFRRAYAAATFVTADGAPVVRLARRSAPDIKRTTGADLVLPLADAAAGRNLPVFLFGSDAGVLGAAAARLAANTEGRLQIAGTEAPPMGFDPESAAADAAIDRIVASGARICFVALGAPKQEILAARAVARGAPLVFVCIGAALDFIAGAQVRAPRVLQNNGMEWVWRLATNPRRLAARYAQCGLLLADLTLLEPFRRRARDISA